jgi:hypothetical protein
MFISQVATLYLKRYNHNNSAQFLQVVIPTFAYGFPLVWGIFTYRLHSLDGANTNELYFSEVWMIIEIQYFMYWILSLAIFMLLANCVKYKSIRKKPNDMNEGLQNQHKLDVWRSIRTDDYLRYLKWEAFTVGFYIT